MTNRKTTNCMNKGILEVNWEKIAYVLLWIWCILPVLELVAYFTKNNHRMDAYYIFVMIPGMITIVFAVFYLLCQYLTIGWKKFLTYISSHPWIFGLAILLFWNLIGVFLSDNKEVAIYGTDYRNEGFLCRCIYIAVFICASAIKTRNRKRTILKWIVVVGTIVCISPILQYISSCTNAFGMQAWKCFSSDSVIYLDTFTYPGVFFQFNHYGYYLVIVILAAAVLFITEEKREWQYIEVCMLLLNTWCLVMNDTFGAYLAVVIGSVFLIILFAIYDKKITWKLFIPIVVLLFASIVGNYMLGSSITNNFTTITKDVNNIVSNNAQADRGGSGRWLLWKTAMHRIIQKPWFGYGEHALRADYKALGFFTDRPTNEYLGYAVILGVPAAVAYMGTLIWIAIRQIRQLRKLPTITIMAAICVLGYAVSAFVGNTTFYITPYMFMLLAFAACQEKIE